MGGTNGQVSLPGEAHPLNTYQKIDGCQWEICGEPLLQKKEKYFGVVAFSCECVIE